MAPSTRSVTAARRARRERALPDEPIVIAYSRVSTVGQVESGLGLDAQRAALAAAATFRGWQHVEYVADEGISGGSITARPELTAALERLDAGEADILVASKLDRVSRSVADLANLMQRAQDHGWSLVLLDIGVDTSTPAGQLVVNIMGSMAEYERSMAKMRTREALARIKASGRHLGEPFAIPADVVARIVDEHAAGTGIRAIARALTAEGVPTARGGSNWAPTTVKTVIDRHAAPQTAVAKGA